MEVYPRRRMEKLRTFYSQSRARYIDSARISRSKRREAGDIVREKRPREIGGKGKKCAAIEGEGERGELLRYWKAVDGGRLASRLLRSGFGKRKRALLVKKRERERENERERKKKYVHLCVRDSEEGRKPATFIARACIPREMQPCKVAE